MFRLASFSLDRSMKRTYRSDSKITSKRALQPSWRACVACASVLDVSVCFERMGRSVDPFYSHIWPKVSMVSSIIGIIGTLHAAKAPYDVGVCAL